jgi:hypothetical protein
MTTPSAHPAVHPAVSGYAARHRVDVAEIGGAGRLTLRFDGRYRVQVEPAADGQIALSSRLLDLGERAPDDTQETLQRLAALGAGLLRDHAAGLCIDESRGVVMLQQLLPTDTDLDRLEEEMADYVNALAFWTRACANEAGGSA